MKVIQSSVVRALVAIVVGVMLILYRKATLEWMVIITGALFFLSGCLSCLAYYWGRRKAIRAAQVIDEEGRVVGPHTPPLPIAGVGSVLLGLILMMMTGSFIRGVAYVLALNQLVTLGGARRYARIPVFYWLLPTVTLVVGAVILLKPVETMASPLLIIGWCMVYYGVAEALNSLKVYQLQRQFRKAEEASIVVGEPQETSDEED